MKLAIGGYRGERSALVVVVACLLVVAAVVGWNVVDERHDRESEIRARGVSIARLLSGFPTDGLLGPEAYSKILQLLSFSQGSQDFAYAAVVDRAGNRIAEVVAPNVTVPQARVPDDPSAWIGERETTIESLDVKILEFHAPVFESGELIGQIRLGLFEPQYRLVAGDLSAAGSLALLVFLLAPLFSFLLRREIKPLVAAGTELERLLQDAQINANSPPGAPIGAFMDRFDRFVDYAQTRIRELEDDRGELVATAKLISYKKARIEAILQTLPEAVLVLDEHGKITYTNERVSLLLGASKDRILSGPPSAWCDVKEVVAYFARYEGASTPRYGSDATYFSPADDSEKTYAIRSYPLFSSSDASAIKGTLVVISDETIENLAKKSRSELIAHLGHELKTPLNTLALYSEALLDDAFDDEADRVDAVNTIHDEVERLTGLVKNLLSITRIEVGSLDLARSRTRFADLLNDIAVSLGRAASLRDIEIKLEIPSDLSPLEVDKDLLRIAINNLVSNAVKYNQAGGRVTVSAEETDEAVMVHVADTGLGISEDDQKRIFEKFFRSDSQGARERTGHGLGLALAKQIVDLHEAELTVESRLGAGSTFTITFWKRFGVVSKAI